MENHLQTFKKPSAHHLHQYDSRIPVFSAASSLSERGRRDRAASDSDIAGFIRNIHEFTLLTYVY